MVFLVSKKCHLAHASELPVFMVAVRQAMDYHLMDRSVLHLFVNSFHPSIHPPVISDYSNSLLNHCNILLVPSLIHDLNEELYQCLFFICMGAMIISFLKQK